MALFKDPKSFIAGDGDNIKFKSTLMICFSKNCLLPRSIVFALGNTIIYKFREVERVKRSSM
jgi:hypothetical protein